MSFWKRLWSGLDDLLGGLFSDDDQPKRRRRRRGGDPPLSDPDRASDPYGYARGTDPDTGADFRVIAWTGPGGLSDWRSLEGDDIPTEREIENADLLVIEFTYPDGETVYRTFKGPTADIQRAIDDWKEIGSI